MRSKMAATIAPMMIPAMAPIGRSVSTGGVSVISDRALRSVNPASAYTSSFSCVQHMRSHEMSVM